MNSKASYRMPAEWESQSAIWLSWPQNVETWPHNLEAAQSEFVKLVKAIGVSQSVFVLASPEAKDMDDVKVDQVHETFFADPNVTVVDIPTNDAWARDYAPTFVLSRCESGSMRDRPVAIDWHYNAWGGKYPPYDDDQKVCQRIADHLKIPTVIPDFCFEGGAIEINESGVLMSTRSCALDVNRNPNCTLEDADALLSKFLGTTKHIWLTGDALQGDDTDGHIDQLARFVNDETIVYAWTEDKSDSQFAALKQNRDDLRRELDSAGLEHYQLVALPIPAPIEYCERRIPASYCNFLITNDLVIVPQFGQPEDKVALKLLTPFFPMRKIVGLPSLNLAVGLGSFHCLSQQQPQVPKTT